MRTNEWCAQLLRVGAPFFLAGCSMLFPLSGISDGSPNAAPDSASGDAGTPSDGGHDSGDGGGSVDPDLIGFWPFDEGSGSAVHDRSGNGFDGTMSGGATWSTGRPGATYALSFDGNDGLVTVPSSARLHVPTSDLTVATWLNPTVIAPNPPQSLAVFIHAGSSWYVRLNGSHAQITDSNSRSAFALQGVNTGEWQHVAFTFQAGVGVTAYINGSSVGISDLFSTKAAFSADTEGLTFGGILPGGALAGCSCKMSDVRIYKRALTAAEINLLAQ